MKINYSYKNQAIKQYVTDRNSSIYHGHYRQLSLRGHVWTACACFAAQRSQSAVKIYRCIAVQLLVIIPKFFPGSFSKGNFATGFFQRLRHAFGQLFFKKNQSTLFAIGFLNGLLPCGLVYLAIAAATAAGNISSSIVFMAAFGLGTLPVMWSIAFWGNFIGINIRQKIRAAYPYMMLLMACLLIIRGMGLGIPYLSPVADMDKKIINCCAKP